jgi:K+-sensing histidine kinase KdpD
LQLVRLTSGDLDLMRDWESIEEIVGSVLARLRQRDPTRRIKSRVPAELPLVRADRCCCRSCLPTCSTTRSSTATVRSI